MSPSGRKDTLPATIQTGVTREPAKERARGSPQERGETQWGGMEDPTPGMGETLWQGRGGGNQIKKEGSKRAKRGQKEEHDGGAIGGRSTGKRGV